MLSVQILIAGIAFLLVFMRAKLRGMAGATSATMPAKQTASAQNSASEASHTHTLTPLRGTFLNLPLARASRGTAGAQVFASAISKIRNLPCNASLIGGKHGSTENYAEAQENSAQGTSGLNSCQGAQ